MTDPFQQFGGKVIEPSDPFEKFGGKIEEGGDPFAQFGGEQQPDDEYSKVRGIIDRSFWAAPLVESETTTDAELEAIARHHKVDGNKFKELSAIFGAIREEGQRDIPTEVVSSVARGPGMNIPQFASKKLDIDDPAMRAAIDDLQDLADAKRSFARGLAENFVPLGAIRKAVVKGGEAVLKEGAKQTFKEAVKQTAKEGAVIGAASGLGRSKEGEEVRSTLIGAGVGTGLGAGASTVAAGFSKAGKWLRAEKEMRDQVNRQMQVDLDAAGQEIAQRTAQAEKELEQVVLREAELAPETAEKIVTQMMDSNAVRNLVNDDLAVKRVVGESPDLVQNYGAQRAILVKQAEDLAEQRIYKFAEDLSGEAPKTLEDAREVITDFSKRQGGPEALSQRYKGFVQNEQRLQGIAEKGIAATDQAGFWGKALNFISDAQFVLRGIDNSYNLGLEKVHHALNRNYNRLTYAKAGFQSELNDIHKMIQKQGLTESLPRIVDALDGKTVDLNSTEQAIVDRTRQYLDNFLSYVNGSVRAKDPGITPLSIPRLKAGYFPHTLRDTNELINGFEKLKAQVLETASRTLGRRVTDLSDIPVGHFNVEMAGRTSGSPLKQLVDGLQVFDNKPVANPSDLSRRFKEQLYQRSGRISMESKARAAMERTGAMPQWMMERDMFKALDRYTGNTLRHLYLRKPVQDLASISKTLGKAGAEVESRYVSNLVQDLMGIRKGTAAETAMQVSLQFRQRLDEEIAKHGKDSFRGALAIATKAVPDFINMLLKQVYPNYLGLSPRALIQNSTQLVTKTIPELGPAYGPVAVLRAGVNAVLNLPANLKRLEQMGLQPEAFVAGNRAYVAEGLAASLPARLAGKSLQQLSEAALFLYSKMDSINRAFTLSLADQMTYDLARGSKLARGALDRFPPSIRKAADAALATGDSQALNRALAEYLNSVTQYNYNRASLSEFGRTMGPLFSTFSKWPTATAGDMIQEFREKGLIKGSIRNAEKYVMPFLVLQLFDAIILGEQQGEDPSDRQKLLTGRYGLSSSAPIGTVKSIVTGDFFTPPAVDTVVKGLIVPALDKDTDKLSKGLHGAMEGFAPGYVLYRFFTEDLPTYVTGFKPEK